MLLSENNNILNMTVENDNDSNSKHGKNYKTAREIIINSRSNLSHKAALIEEVPLNNKNCCIVRIFIKNKEQQSFRVKPDSI